MTFLLGDTPPPPAPLAPALDPVAEAAPEAPGGLAYLALCAGCHGLEGSGVPNTMVAMRGNSTLRLSDPRNLIVSMLDGIRSTKFPVRAEHAGDAGLCRKVEQINKLPTLQTICVSPLAAKGPT